MTSTALARPFGHVPRPAPAAVPMAVHVSAFAALVILNWLAAAAVPDVLFAYTSTALFLWLVVLVARLYPRAAILLLPVAITRFATMLSLIAIESGAYMPEVNQLGTPGDASASFLAFTAIMFLVFVAVFARIERVALSCARSQLLDRVTGLLAWPVVLVCAAWGLLALKHGFSSGFPLIAGVDRFLYRRYYSDAAVLLLLDNKLLLAGLLGTIAFSRRARVLRVAAIGVIVALTAVYFLFGDKFFTILAELSVFLMPFLLPRSERLLPLVFRLLPLAAVVIAVASAATLYIYSDYGRLPADRTIQLMGERVAGQGELWFVANRDYRRLTNWDESLIARYIAVLPDKEPPTSAFRNGVETYYFVQHYSPAKLAASFRKNQGWVQLTIGTEAMALVIFGYVGVGVIMVLAGLLLALSAAYLERAFVSGFPISLFFAVWTYLQVSFALQQASLWPIAAPGQIKRFLLFFVIEAGLFAINRAEPWIAARRYRPGVRGRIAA